MEDDIVLEAAQGFLGFGDLALHEEVGELLGVFVEGVDARSDVVEVLQEHVLAETDFVEPLHGEEAADECLALDAGEPGPLVDFRLCLGEERGLDLHG